MSRKMRTERWKLTPVRTRPLVPDVSPGVVEHVVADEMHGFAYQTIAPDASPDEIEAFLHPARRETFDAYLSDLRQRADADLAENGWPPVDRYVLNRGRSWNLAPDHVVADPFAGHPEYADASLSLGSAYIIQNWAPFERDWFIMKIAEQVRLAQTSKGDASVWAAHELGRLLEIYEHRAFQPLVKKAAKNWRDASAGGQARAIAEKPRTSAILAEMSRLVGEGHSVARAGEFCARKGVGSSGPANAKLWYRHR